MVTTLACDVTIPGVGGWGLKLLSTWVQLYNSLVGDCHQSLVFTVDLVLFFLLDFPAFRLRGLSSTPWPLRLTLCYPIV